MNAKTLAAAVRKLSAEGVCPRCLVPYRTAEGGEPKCPSCSENQVTHLAFTIEEFELDEVMSDVLSDLSSRCLAYTQTVSSQVQQIIELEDTITYYRDKIDSMSEQLSKIIDTFKERSQL